MQGTVWAGLRCTATMDKLGKYVYNNPELAYKYKAQVHLPLLEMVDDVLTISKCGAAFIAMNAVVNAFMGSKKLILNSAKCAKIHVGKLSSQCPQLKPQYKLMNNSDKEKIFRRYNTERWKATCNYCGASFKRKWYSGKHKSSAHRHPTAQLQFAVGGLLIGFAK